jgi:hypothetical protein
MPLLVLELVGRDNRFVGEIIIEIELVIFDCNICRSLQVMTLARAGRLFAVVYRLTPNRRLKSTTGI